MTNSNCFIRQRSHNPLKEALLFFMILLINSCTINVKPEYIEDDKKNAEREIEKFHTRLSKEDYEGIYNSSAPALRNSMSKSDLFKAMKNSHDTFGQFESVVDKRVNVIVGAPVQIRAAYISKYSKTDITETFIFIKNGELIELAFYQTFKGRSELPKISAN